MLPYFFLLILEEFLNQKYRYWHIYYRNEETTGLVCLSCGMFELENLVCFQFCHTLKVEIGQTFKFSYFSPGIQ